MEHPAGAKPEQVAAAVAKRLKADATLIGRVSVYQERVGSRLGADPPAIVGFEDQGGGVGWANALGR